MILCGSTFDLNIDLDSTNLFRETIIGNRSAIFLANARLNISVEGKAGTLTITFDNILCNQTGGYNISIYGGNASSMAALKIIVNPGKPNITAPPNIYKDQEATFTCVGQLGNVNASMYWQLMLTGGKFDTYTVNGSPVISRSSCSIIGSWTVQLYPAENWNGSSIRCLITTPGNSSTEIYSDTILIVLKQPDIYFAPPLSSGYIGSPYRMTCQVMNMTNIKSVKIERDTAFAIREEVASIASNGSTKSNFNGIRINSNSSISATSATIYVDFDNLTCKDEGDYYCNTARDHFTILRKPEKPILTFPQGVLENSQQDMFNCTGEVGHPPGSIVFETNKDDVNTFTRAPFTPATNVIHGNCSATYTATFTYKFTMDWNNTIIRCRADNSRVLGDNETSPYVEKKLFIVPANICRTSNTLYIPHPYDCHKYIQCGMQVYLRECPAGLCRFTQPHNDTYCEWTCNNCTGKFKSGL
ncbi:hypothetical protein ACJMK2_018270 [Sinanodonta woodiana]|uniref:Chitin-binding type-2 domain-containing protein n=1 Tax=Sinanodonta woodiana TaxID=1069815 RepID=A0ABD3UD78_SINWO